MEAGLSHLGIGVVLAWLAFPLFTRVARQSRSASPETYHRTLLFALALSLTPIAAPMLRAACTEEFGATPANVLFSADTILVVPAWLSSPAGQSEAVATRDAIRSLSAWVACLWLFGVAFGLLRLARAEARSRQLLRSARPAPEFAALRITELARARGIKPPRVLVSDDPVAPCTARVISPVIVLANDNLTNDGYQLDFVLRHELEHVARHDTRIALWVKLALLAFVGHPSARRLGSELAFAREARVDEVAGAAAPLEYARFLLSSAERSSGLDRARPAAVAMSDTALARRIQMLTSPTRSVRGDFRSSTPVVVLGSALLGSVLVAPVAWSDQAGARPEHDRSNTSSRGEPETFGQLPSEVIQKVVRARHEGFQRCYERLPEPRSRTSMDLHFTIGRDGAVTEGHIDSARFPELGACSHPVMLGLRFPAPKGGVVTVVYPIEFAPADDPSADHPNPNASRLPPEKIHEVVRNHYPDFKRCYERLPQPRPTLRVKLHFTIGVDGRVDEGHVDSEASPPLGSCIEPVMRGFVFPSPEGGVVTVAYPVEFAP